MPSPSLSRSASQLLSGALFSGALFWGIAHLLGVTLLSAPAGAQQVECAQR
ncbi:MAG: hypothetical protein JWM84_1672, partial [Nocardioides sp.]|nr:hypothetical protein [Nocardioides sp.]